MSTGKPNLEVFAETLLEAARLDADILVVTSDSRGSARLTNFCNTVPQQWVELGIAEQNLVGTGAGLASAGKKVFVVSPACFLTARSLEQIKNDVAYSDFPVKLIGISAGVSYGSLGSTHHSLHDLAVLQAIHNLDIVVPADNFETREAILAAINYPRPIYIRFGKKPMPDLHAPGTRFEIGKAIIIRQGSDINFIASGETVSVAVQASQRLESEGISSGVISMHSLRPFDQQAVLEISKHSKAVITVEEHRIYGGLGSRCAQLLMEAGVHPAFRVVGIPDDHTVTGSQEEVFSHYGITADGLACLARQLLSGE